MLHCPCVVFKFIGPSALLESVWIWPLQPVDLVKTSFKQLVHTGILNLEAFSF